MRGWLILLLAGCEGFQPIDQDRVLSLSLADGKSCARMSDDSVRCWGVRPSALRDNQAADAIPVDVTPRAVPELPAAILLASTLTVDCAVLHDRTVRCWSDGAPPAAWDGLDGSVALATGFPTACGVTVDHKLRCGAPLGPVSEVAVSDVADAATSSDAVCVRLSDGTVECGGDSFVRVDLPRPAVELGMGDGFACALDDMGQVSCWGKNDRGQLGDGTTVSRATPRVILSLGWSTHLSVGRAHVCISDSNNGVYCWGANDRGQLGDATSEDRSSPLQVPGLGKIHEVAVGWIGDHSCAIDDQGALFCWGANDRGQLGDATRNDRLQPVRVRF
jgi:hypothetical protein